MTPAALRDLLSRFDPLRPQPASGWRGDIPLPPDLARFYAEVGPFGLEREVGPSPLGVTIPTVGNPFWLPPLSRLWELQAGYRWNARTGRREAGWREGWIVVAERGGDPFILDAPTGEVGHDVHGGGTWLFTRLFPDVFTMAACLGTIGLVHEEAGEELYDADFGVRSEWRAGLVEALRPLVGGSAAEDLAGRFDR